MNRVVDIEVLCLRYRINIVRHRMLISYTISKAFLTFDIEGHVMIYRVRYRKRYSIHPMSFAAERKLPLPRLHHACAEESQRHVPSFAQFHSLINRDQAVNDLNLILIIQYQFKPLDIDSTNSISMFFIYIEYS
jgi:hypothetical protein